MNSNGHSTDKKLRVLVAEDEFLVAFALEEDLRAQGYTVVGPFSKVDAAKSAAASEDIDIAFLDINMNGEMAYAVADELAARHIPFIFLTGYGAAGMPERFQDSPRFGKPYDPLILIRELRRRFPVAS